MLFVLYREARGLAVERLPRMKEVVGLNPTEGKICCFFLHYSIRVNLFHIPLFHVTLLEWNVKNCFVKLVKTFKNYKARMSGLLGIYF